MSEIPIADLVPHAGPMCLLDTVIAWDDDGIHCRGVCPSAARHPLRDADNALPPTALIEYAAQASAAHGTLTITSVDGNFRPQSGRLVGLRNVRMESCPGESATAFVVEVRARRLLADPGGSIYEFSVEAPGRAWVTGRLTIKTAPS